jgi:DNA-directed RNA polymerase specialized sigma24 family protein
MEALVGAGTGSHDDTPEGCCHRQQLTSRVRHAIERLPHSQQTVVRLWMAGTSIEGMVAATGACRDTVLSRKKYAFRRLKLDIGERLQD